MDRDDNAQQMMDEERRQQEALQALMNVAAKGMKEEAELLAYECGLGRVWKQEVKINERRAA